MVDEHETYSLLDAMQEEYELLKEIETYYKSRENGNIRAMIVQEQYLSIERILKRFENGYEFYIGVKDGKPVLMKRQTTKHLEREYPAVAKAKQNLDVLVDLVKGKSDV